MLDKVKQQPPMMESCTKIDDDYAEQVWEPMFWGDVKIKVFTKHEIIEEINEPDVDYYELKINPHGEITRIEAGADLTQLHNICNGCIDIGIDDFVANQTECDPTPNTDFDL